MTRGTADGGSVPVAQRGAATSQPQVEADGEIVIDAERNLREKDLVGRKATNTFRGCKGLFHGTVRCIFEVKPKNKFPVIFSIFFDEDQSEVRFGTREMY